MNRRVLSVLLIPMLLTACSPAASTPQTTGAPIPPQGEVRSANQTATIAASTGLPETMSPESGAAFHPIYLAMYDTPMALNNKFEVVPWAAEKWEQRNPTTWRLTIRKDLTFSNGDKLTAADVAFTGNLIVTGRTPQISFFGSLDKAEAVDESTVDFITKTPDITIPAAMASMRIMPKNYYNQVGKDGFALKPIGSGPYEISEFRASDRVTLKKRATEHPFRKVFLTTLSFRSIPEAGQVVAGFRTGDLDVAEGAITIDRLNDMEKAGATVDARETTMQIMQIPSAEAKMRSSPLQDIRVRQAVNYAIDKEGILKALYGNYGKVIGQFAVPETPAWNPAYLPFPYDPAKAKQLLSEAGYPNGVKLEGGIDFSPNFTNPNIPVAIQGNLKAVGIDTSVNSLESALFLDKFNARNGQVKGDFFTQSGGDFMGFGAASYGYYTCSKPPNTIAWCNPTYDTNMQAALNEPDFTKRGDLMRKAVSVFREDVSHVFLFVGPTYVVLSPKLKGFVRMSSYSYVYDSVYRIE